MKRGFVSRVLVMGAMVALLTGAAFAAMASNDVPDSNAGQGSGDISGYDVSDVTYTLSANGDEITQVEFDLTPQSPGNTPASSAIAVFYGDGVQQGDVYDCDLTDNGNGSQHATCTTDGDPANTQAALELSVTAAQ